MGSNVRPSLPGYGLTAGLLGAFFVCAFTASAHAELYRCDGGEIIDVDFSKGFVAVKVRGATYRLKYERRVFGMPGFRGGRRVPVPGANVVQWSDGDVSTVCTRYWLGG